MPTISDERAAYVIRLQQLLRILNNEYGEGQLKNYFITRFQTALLLRDPDIISSGKPVEYPADEDFKAAAELLSGSLQRWAQDWIHNPPCRTDYDPVAYMQDNADAFKEFHKMTDDLPGEAVLALFVPGHSSQTSAAEPPGPGRRVRYRIKSLPTGARSGRFASLQAYVDDVLGSVRFDSPLLMAKGIAVALFRVLLQSGIRLGQCSLAMCGRYFLNLSGVKRFCSRQHAQAAVNQKRNRRRDAAIARVTKAIKDYELEAKPNRDWKGFVARRAHVSRYWVTLLANKRIIVPPTQNRG